MPALKSLRSSASVSAVAARPLPAPGGRLAQAVAVRCDRHDLRLPRREPDDRGPDRAGRRRDAARTARHPAREPAAAVRGRAAVRADQQEPRVRPRPHDRGAPLRALRATSRRRAYSGIVRYRWKRGKRTVLSGLVRTRKARVAGRRGKAFCSLRVGNGRSTRRRRSSHRSRTTPRWYRGPSGRQLLRVRRPLGRRARRLARRRRPVRARPRDDDRGRGHAPLEYAARDAAGNQTPVKTTTLRVDESPPTRPVVTAPTGSTSDSTPESGGTPRATAHPAWPGYIVVVRNSGGAIAWSRDVPDELAQGDSVTDPLPPGTTRPRSSPTTARCRQPFTATGSLGFTVVPPPPGEPPPPPDADGDGVLDANDNCPPSRTRTRRTSTATSRATVRRRTTTTTASSDTHGAARGHDPLDPDTDDDAARRFDQCPLVDRG